MTKIEALKEIGEGLARVAAAILVFAEEGEEVKTGEPKAAEEKVEKSKAAEEKAKEPKPVEEEKAKEPKPVEEKKAEKKYTLEDVRKELSAKSSAGFTDEVRSLLERHGASKLSAIAESEYAAIMEEVKAIGSSQ